MVVANNEWLNKTENEQISASTDTISQATATGHTGNTAAISAFHTTANPAGSSGAPGEASPDPSRATVSLVETPAAAKDTRSAGRSVEEPEEIAEHKCSLLSRKAPHQYPFDIELRQFLDNQERNRSDIGSSNGCTPISNSTGSGSANGFQQQHIEAVAGQTDQYSQGQYFTAGSATQADPSNQHKYPQHPQPTNLMRPKNSRIQVMAELKQSSTMKRADGPAADPAATATATATATPTPITTTSSNTTIAAETAATTAAATIAAAMMSTANADSMTGMPILEGSGDDSNSTGSAGENNNRDFLDTLLTATFNENLNLNSNAPAFASALAAANLQHGTTRITKSQAMLAAAAASAAAAAVAASAITSPTSSDTILSEPPSTFDCNNTTSTLINLNNSISGCDIGGSGGSSGTSIGSALIPKTSNLIKFGLSGSDTGNTAFNSGYELNVPQSTTSKTSTAVGNNLSPHATISRMSLVDMSSDAESSTSVNGMAKIVLLCEANSHPFQTRTILLTPNVECKVGRLIAKSKSSESNAIFDCKVLSRTHAVLWYSDDGKFWVKDTKSSNGTFVNDKKLGTDPTELHFGDIVKFGVDVVENSRKEVHGCIIACVKLYLPDGRDAISSDAITALLQYSGEGRISYEELHRLNLFMQEAAQREKTLKSKLSSLQSVIDSTRKNSALCWQAMVSEDQLLHRIHSLEKKLGFMEKNVPENVLKSEVIKLLDDKNAYQETAKEALRNVYQERCEAMQMLSKVEIAYTTSEGECKLLRDQIMHTKQSLQDVNSRLLRLESEYNEFREESQRSQTEAKDKSDQTLNELVQKLQQSELECEELRRKVSQLMATRIEIQIDDVARMEQQAIENFDAAIADMDEGDDDDDDDDEDDDEDDDDDDEDDDEAEGNDEVDEDVAERKARYKTNGEVAALDKDLKKTGQRSKNTKTPKHGDESPVMKWLQNSDLKGKEGSLDIFKAICNESDSSDEQETASSPPNAAVADAASAEWDRKCTQMALTLDKVEQCILQLGDDSAKSKRLVVNLIDGDALTKESSDLMDDDVHDDNRIESSTPDVSATIQSNPNYQRLRESINLLRETYTEIVDTVRRQQLPKVQQLARLPTGSGESTPTKRPVSIPTPHLEEGDADDASSAPSTVSTSASARTETLTTTGKVGQIVSDAENDDVDVAESPDYDEFDDISDATELISLATSNAATVNEESPSLGVIMAEEELQKQLGDYKMQISTLKAQLQTLEDNAENTREAKQLMQALREENLVLAAAVQEQRTRSLAPSLSPLPPLIGGDGPEVADAVGQALGVDQSTETIEKVSLKTTATASPSTNSLEPQRSTVSIQNTTAAEADAKADAADPAAVKDEETKVKAEPTVAPGVVSEGDGDEISRVESQVEEEWWSTNTNALEREEELIMYKERLELTELDNLKLRSEIAKIKSDVDWLGAHELLKTLLPYGAILIAIIVYFIVTHC